MICRMNHHQTLLLALGRHDNSCVSSIYTRCHTCSDRRLIIAAAAAAEDMEPFGRGSVVDIDVGG
ncbi:hypothetical protein HanRHA438_Chr08g0342551 [Helianthus annuus]|nr:hypothetical protein HanRHA438_Chr08g0342551 [Helianthus annuus]